MFSIDNKFKEEYKNYVHEEFLENQEKNIINYFLIFQHYIQM